jgi:hypothetical protein
MIMQSLDNATQLYKAGAPMRGDHTLGMSHRKPETSARFEERSQTIVKAASHADLLSSRN